MSSSIMYGRIYKCYIGKVGPVPRILSAISLKKWNEKDPCDLSKTIGTQYTWMYSPSYIENNHKGFSLDKPDHPTDQQAPPLIYTEGDFGEENYSDREFGEKWGKEVLRVPVSINNIVELFKRPRTGHPSTYEFNADEIVEQQGNKRIPAGWICMRKNVIGRNLSFTKQQVLAHEKRVTIPHLLHRILYNFLKKVHYYCANINAHW